MTEIPGTCAHCGSRLKKWRVPDEATWDEEFFYVCFNDECSYFQSGWEWMKERYSQRASYRYAINPGAAVSTMIPVWSDTATREMIEEHAEGGEE